MTLRTVSLYAISLIVLGGIGYINYGRNREPPYVRAAQESVSTKMSYTYGIAKCVAKQQNAELWHMTCTTKDGEKVLAYTVMPSAKAPYSLHTSYYLVAENDVTRDASGEDLLGYLSINTDVKAHSLAPRVKKK